MVTTVVSPERLQVPTGAVLRIPATWAEYQALMRQRGDRSVPRMKYRHGELLLMSPLPVHGRDSHLLGQIVIALLDHKERDHDGFTPVTMDLPEESGIEPDYCFYIDNWEAVSGKERIDWQVDPPPDLVIEVDVTSYTEVDDYAAYGVPEIWLWKRQVLKIYGLVDGGYALHERSRFFPELELMDLVATCFEEAYGRNTSFAIRNLRRRLMEGEV